MADEVDPWDWDQDQVVKVFCHDCAQLPIPSVTSILPEPVAFEALLRENDVNGSTLLTDISGEVLKADFNIKSIGQRNAVVFAISELRKKSQKYALHNPSPAYGLHSHPSIVGSFHTPFARTPFPDVYSPPLTHQRLHDHNDAIATSGASPVFARPSIPERSPLQGMNGPEHGNLEDGSPNRRRLGETVVEGGAGRKKRRLDLTATSKPAPVNESTEAGGEQLPASSDTTFVTSKTSAQGTSATDNVKSAELRRFQMCGLEPGVSSYLGKKKFTLNDMFFGTTKDGSVLNQEVDLLPLTDAGVVSDEVFIFNAGEDEVVAGRQAIANRRMISFLSNKAEWDVEIGDDALAFYPYAPESSSNPASRALICIQNNHGTLSASRQNLANVKPGSGDVAEQATSSSPSNHEWDFLKHWEKADHDELPVYGDSDSEDTSELDALEAEIEADRDEDREASKTHLSLEQASMVIDDAIAHQVQTFKEKQLPVLQEKSALSTWRKGKNSIERRILANLADGVIAQCDAYIDKMRARILEERWESKRALKQQCECLEETVKQREKEKFKVNVWRRATAPPAPTGKLRVRKRHHVHSSDDHTEHLVDSDEEVVDDREDHFIDLDEIPEVDMTAVEEVEELESQSQADPAKRQEDPDDQQEEPEETDAATVHSEFESDSVIGRGQPSGETEDKPDSASKEIKEEPNARFEKRAKQKFTAPSSSDIIDLTFDSDTEVPAQPAPPPRPSQADTQAMRYSSHPEEDTDAEIADWDFGDLEYREDRRRIVIKLLRTMPEDEYHHLRDYVLEENDDQLGGHIYDVGSNIFKILRKRFGKLDQFEIAEFAYDRANELLHLYICWLECAAEYFRVGHVEKQEALELVELDEALLEGALSQMENDDHIDLMTCLGLVHMIFSKHPHPIGCGSEESDEVEEITPDQATQQTPRKVRKRAVAESQDVISKRKRNENAVLAWEKRAQKFHTQVQTQSSDHTGIVDEGVVVNDGKEEHEEAIYINPHVVKTLKPHQIDGIRFMWREVVGIPDDEEDTQGCLLAHTMGLGKTAQVITFLTTLAKAAKDARKEVRRQVPKKLRKLRVLILCPAGLINNWDEEFKIWNRNQFGLGNLCIITAQTSKHDRLELLDEWYNGGHGSVLLMGYELFRTWALNSTTAKREPPFSDEEHKQIKQQLLEGPNLVIADEAHKLKKHDSQVTQAAKLLRTKNRIALTGSPLSNNLTEYFAMVDWISPFYLGSLVQFKANYVEPIELGLYGDCMPHERKRARVKLAALIRILEPKIHRREIDTLKHELPPRTQFVLTVPLTDAQMKIYRAFISHAVNGINESTSTARLWGLMAYLQLLCSHPTLFEGAIQAARKKIEADRAKRSKSPIKRIRQLQDQEPSRSPIAEGDDTDQSEETRDGGDDDGSVPADPVSQQIAEKVLHEQGELFARLSAGAHEVGFSNKLNLLMQIVRRSVKVKDKLLIFSHRLPTLDFLGEILRKAGIKWARLDGSTQMNKRQGMTKSFNEGGMQVFLISTRAGGTGFNLFGANRVVLFDFSFNPTWEEQAIGRAYRLGQTKPVIVYRFNSAGTFEDALFNQTIFKLQLAGEVVEKKKTKSKASRFRDYIKMPSESQAEDHTSSRGQDSVLDSILDEEVTGAELIHGIKLDTIFKEEDQEVLTLEEQQEMQRLIQDNKRMNADPEAWRQQHMQLLQPIASTARVPLNPQLHADPAYGLGRPSSTAPIAPTLQPGRRHASATDIPQAAFIPPPTTREPHGLPFPMAPQFNAGSMNGITAFAPAFSPGLSNGGRPSSLQGQSRRNGT